VDTNVYLDETPAGRCENTPNTGAGRSSRTSAARPEPEAVRAGFSIIV
jgi:hypothetical protein